MLNDLWIDLVTTATLGTERRAPAWPQPAGQLGALLSQVGPADREGALLSAAAIVSLYRRAARLPQPSDTPALPAADQDDLPVCPPGALQHLAALLDGAQRGLLPEWLAALAQSGRRVPAAYLPALLELGRGQPALHAQIVPVLGARGRWLATQNPAWSYAVPAGRSSLPRADDRAALAGAWETGARPARLALLLELRTRAPQIARELLAASWATERADDRAAYVAALEHNLSDDDEPLLEAALDDRSKEVRRAAALLLARLPHSRLVGRMCARAQPLLAFVAERPRAFGVRRSRAPQLVVTLPAACDAAMQRDGIVPQLPGHRQKLGERAWWLIQILSAIPPAIWSEQWQVAPATLIGIAAHGEWRQALLEGWQAAALNARDAGWAEALLRHGQSTADLISVLPAERQDALLIEILRGDCMPLHKHPVLDMLRKTEHRWSAALTRAVLRATHRHMRSWNDSYDYQLRGALTDEFARRMPPELLPEIMAGWPDEPAVRERWQGVIDKLLITVQFRHDMLRALG